MRAASASLLSLIVVLVACRCAAGRHRRAQERRQDPRRDRQRRRQDGDELRHLDRRRRQPDDSAHRGRPHPRSIAQAGRVPSSCAGASPTRSSPTGSWPNGAATRSSSTSTGRSSPRSCSSNPNHEQARLALGHQKQTGGGWKSRDEVMAARGLDLLRRQILHTASHRAAGTGQGRQADRRRLGQPARPLAALAHRPPPGPLRRGARGDSQPERSRGRARRRRAAGRRKRPRP